MGKIYGYIRASTSGQEYTYDAQITAIKPMLQRWHEAGGELGRIYKDEAVSGTTQIFERPAGREMLKVLKRGDKVVFAKIDRGFRSLADYAQFVELTKTMGVEYAAADLGIDSSTPTGQFLYTVMAAFAQLERQFISQRTKEGLAARISRCIPSSHRAPPGWRQLPNGEWDADYVERKVIAWMERQHDLNHSYRQIARQLDKWGIKRFNGKSMGREFVQMAIWAKSMGYPGVSGWGEKWIRERAERMLRSQTNR